MILSDLSVKRPVFATVINLLIITFGIVAFLMLPLREYPDIDPPIVNISTNYPGASAAIVETKITQLLEDRISGVEGVKTINSNSRVGRSSITIEFNLDRDIDAATNDVRDRISRALNNLPEQADPPEVSKANDDENVIVWFVLQSETMSTLALTDYANRYIVDRFAVVDGVARIRVGGGRTYAMKIRLNRASMAARNITVQDIERTLRDENVELPAGRIESVDRDFSIRVERSYLSEQDFANMVIDRSESNSLVRLGDVAEVFIGAQDDENMFRGNGKNMVGLGVIKQSKGNTLDVVKSARKEMIAIRNTLPVGTTITNSYDSSVFIEGSIDEVYNTLIIAMLMVVLVIFLFLGNVRATLIPAITVPVALIGSMMALSWFGFSINLLTLLALVLAIGLVVDDAIVVLENIYRRIENGQTPLMAAYEGGREVAFAVVATTLVLVAVFVPLVFLSGNMGRLFTEFAIAISAAVIFSSLTALSLTPMMCSKMLKHRERSSSFGQKLDRAFARFEASYGRALKSSIHQPMLIVLVLGLALAAVFLLFNKLPSEYTPKEDRGNFFLMMQSAEGASYENNVKNMHEIEEKLLAYQAQGELDRVLVRVPGFGGSGGVAIVGLPEWDKRSIDTFSFINKINADMQSVTDVRAFAIMRRGIGGGGGDNPVSFVLQGNTFEELAQWRDILITEAQKNPNLSNINSDYQETYPQLLVQIDRERAYDLGVTVGDIAQTLETMLGQRRVTTFVDRGEEYDVIVEGDEKQFQSPADIENLYIRSRTTDKLIPLASVLNIGENATSSQLNRYNRLRSITVTANLTDGYALGDALDFLVDVTKNKLPEHVQVDYKGESLLLKESGNSIMFVFLLALLITYLVLAAQFESFIHPFVILLTVPLALVGALAGLELMGMSLNIYSQIGIIMLIGLAAKNGILIVEFANQLRDKGIAFEEALISASQQRLRPIVMTTFTTVTSAIPLVFAVGPGAESRMVIGVVIFAGVSLASIFTLFIVPGAYYWLCRNTGSPQAIANKIEQQS
ncbi:MULTISPECIES: efflux RND transporter permease subunit [unclassified Colwellia]|uniref:efflux RND transporter permease subunit n=1 Tax=unclassified Colwellia TaxID=196834 RepID=UPI0015F645D3|nr:MULTISPECIES: efflux RND transporter permease subunit [unclassified Colwellia]MBA6381281.1 efflux RND transporter permease subunit [Colwellia sp. BRX10-7]MBA6389027.1 efflux RND transporter permease subunit [Colwellia sp. BRX10-2]MBA6403763.1 efflux RND transporter permease subunit [Colwellia sp. BRX10-5]MBA6407385.1 efflux RND transporter permease subunit [Colwellia sp. BRX10-1]